MQQQSFCRQNCCVSVEQRVSCWMTSGENDDHARKRVECRQWGKSALLMPVTGTQGRQSSTPLVSELAASVVDATPVWYGHSALCWSDRRATAFFTDSTYVSGFSCSMHTIQQRVAPVQTTSDKRLDNGLSGVWSKSPNSWSDLLQLVKTRPTNSSDMIRQWQLAVSYDSRVTRWLDDLDQRRQHWNGADVHLSQ